jgi:hypothetical protein
MVPGSQCNETSRTTGIYLELLVRAVVVIMVFSLNSQASRRIGQTATIPCPNGGLPLLTSHLSLGALPTLVEVAGTHCDGPVCEVAES